MHHPRNQEIEAKFALVVTSDTRTPNTDETGKLAIRKLEEAGHEVMAYLITPNNSDMISETIRGLLSDERIQVIITSGGTGISPRDKTVDVARVLFSREVNGFGEAFRRFSYDEIGGLTMISRATCGVSNGKLIFCLPGSTGAMELALMDLIIPNIGHMLWELSRE
ncbi:MAG: molybdenum cofactor biosynthesis protein B [Candidatus Bathyarchaeia archaeon]